MDRDASHNKMLPPLNFAMVDKGIYRSGYPNKSNFPFLKRLGLKTILFLCFEEYSQLNLNLYADQGIRFIQCGLPGNKEPFVCMPTETVRKAVKVLLDPDNRPVLIHCNKGKHRTGTVTGCYRKACGWSLTSIFDEYRRFCGAKVRYLDQQFVELFDLEQLWMKEGES